MALFQRKESIPSGDLIFDRRTIVKIIVPMFIQQVLAITVGMVDSMMVSHAGEAAVSGVSLVNTLDNMLIVFFTALVSGGSVVVAQTLGTQNNKEVTEVAKQLLYATTAVAILLTTVVMILRRPLLGLLFGDVEADVMQSALDYFTFVAISFPLLAITESTGACFRSSGNTLITLFVSFAINIMNVCGNAILIFGFDMGAKGAALATTFARFGGAIILIILIHNQKYPVHIQRLFHYKPDFKTVRRILNIGVPNGTENAMFSFGRLLTQTLISLFPTTVIAANSVALSIANYQYAVNTAFSACVVPIVGRCIGAKKEDQAKGSFHIALSERNSQIVKTGGCRHCHICVAGVPFGTADGTEPVQQDRPIRRCGYAGAHHRLCQRSVLPRHRLPGRGHCHRHGSENVRSGRTGHRIRHSGQCGVRGGVLGGDVIVIVGRELAPAFFLLFVRFII